jgi:hypothetical protein
LIDVFGVVVHASSRVQVMEIAAVLVCPRKKPPGTSSSSPRIHSTKLGDGNATGRFGVCSLYKNIGTLFIVSIFVSTCTLPLPYARVEGCKCFGTDYTHLRQTHWGTYRAILVAH